MIKFIRSVLARRTFAYKLRNKAMNMFSSFDNFKSIRKKAETKRQAENRPHEVLYFHKVDDPYSHLTIQFIDKFRDSFDVVSSLSWWAKKIPLLCMNQRFIQIIVWKM